MAEAFESALTPDLLAETEVSCDADVPVCVSAELWARHMAESKAPVRIEAMVLFMSGSPENYELGLPPGIARKAYDLNVKMQAVFHPMASGWCYITVTLPIT